MLDQNDLWGKLKSNEPGCIYCPSQLNLSQAFKFNPLTELPHNCFTVPLLSFSITSPSFLNTAHHHLLIWHRHIQADMHLHTCGTLQKLAQIFRPINTECRSDAAHIREDAGNTKEAEGSRNCFCGHLTYLLHTFIMRQNCVQWM